MDEASGTFRFRDFLRDEPHMARLFEDFIFNFYRIERPKMVASKDRINWLASSREDPDSKSRQKCGSADVVLRGGGRTIVIDAKYYKETFQGSYSETAHSANLYQLLAYLKNLKETSGMGVPAEGILLYPVVDQSVQRNYQMHGHIFRIRTVDLSRPWQEIHKELLEIVA